ncbi:dnaJ homolog subfamily C member 17-like [Homarus americanus]|uniref:dnaJ homolog subfamily C member 17-like n=1 Tax=Homarus americanus TaxID=6706 RepID=UPI001C480E5A|nr:dnaJ homolog subfamily C member 17-like [Homarus americanus]
MSKKNKKELTKLDFYEILGISIGAKEQEIRKSYRKEALKCHPDKNPDNPDAAEEFDRLKKILEILLDPGTRRAYDKVLKSRKAAAVRAREVDAKTQRLRSDLEERERRAQRSRDPQLSEEEKFRRELKRLEEEGERLIEEELTRVNKQVEEELSRGTAKVSKSKETPSTDSNAHRVKVKWAATEDWPGYTEQDIHQLFFKWGDINALVMQQKTKKGTALIDFKTKQGADMAVQFEKGQVGKPLEVSYIVEKLLKQPKPDRKTEKQEESTLKPNLDYESITAMNQRRQDERRKLIEQIMKEEGMTK